MSRIHDEQDYNSINNLNLSARPQYGMADLMAHSDKLQDDFMAQLEERMKLEPIFTGMIQQGLGGKGMKGLYKSVWNNQIKNGVLKHVAEGLPKGIVKDTIADYTKNGFRSAVKTALKGSIEAGSDALPNVESITGVATSAIDKAKDLQGTVSSVIQKVDGAAGDVEGVLNKAKGFVQKPVTAVADKLMGTGAEDVERVLKKPGYFLARKLLRSGTGDPTQRAFMMEELKTGIPGDDGAGSFPVSGFTKGTNLQQAVLDGTDKTNIIKADEDLGEAPIESILSSEKLTPAEQGARAGIKYAENVLEQSETPWQTQQRKLLTEALERQRSAGPPAARMDDGGAATKNPESELFNNLRDQAAEANEAPEPEQLMGKNRAVEGAEPESESPMPGQEGAANAIEEAAPEVEEAVADTAVDTGATVAEDVGAAAAAVGVEQVAGGEALDAIPIVGELGMAAAGLGGLLGMSLIHHPTDSLQQHFQRVSNAATEFGS